MLGRCFLAFRLSLRLSSPLEKGNRATFGEKCEAAVRKHKEHWGSTYEAQGSSGGSKGNTTGLSVNTDT